LFSMVLSLLPRMSARVQDKTCKRRSRVRPDILGRSWVPMLTITSSPRPAPYLGFLLHKHPDRLHTVDLAFGRAHVFYPEAREDSCTAALLLDVDAVGLVRRGSRDASPLAEYVSDRPYAASSFLSVAISRVFGTALGGRCAKRPDL